MTRSECTCYKGVIRQSCSHASIAGPEFAAWALADQFVRMSRESFADNILIGIENATSIEKANDVEEGNCSETKAGDVRRPLMVPMAT